MKNLKNKIERVKEITDVDFEVVNALVVAGIVEPEEVSSLEYSSYNENIVNVGTNREYLIVDEDSVFDLVYENILDSLWAFTPDFLAEYTEIDRDVFISLQKLYEDGNEAVKRLVETTDRGIEGLVGLAIEYDGAGHFLAYYDGEELEIEVYGEKYCVYRTN